VYSEGWCRFICFIAWISTTLQVPTLTEGEPTHISRAMLATSVAKWVRAFCEVRWSAWLEQR